VDEQRRKTGGRQKGSRNKSKIAREEAAAKVVEAIGEVIPDACYGGAAHSGRQTGKAGRVLLRSHRA
jgi:hypothetical protein